MVSVAVGLCDILSGTVQARDGMPTVAPGPNRISKSDGRNPTIDLTLFFHSKEELPQAQVHRMREVTNFSIVYES